MVDATQLLLVFVIVTITVMLSVIFTQIFFILKEFKKTLYKANKVLDDTGIISESVSKPVSMVSTMLTGAKLGSTIMNVLSKKEKDAK